MRKFYLKLVHSVAALVCLAVLIAGTVYALALTVKSVRAAFEGTIVERFLPHEETGDTIPDSRVGEANAAEAPSVEVLISPAAAKNIGLDDAAITTIQVTDYYKSFSCPAVVVERPGFSTITVPAPASGVVMKIHYESGVAVEPGEPLFDILLNQQELVKSQTEFLTLLQKRAINTAELERLAGLDPQMIPKQRRELDYEKIQIDSEIDIQKNILFLQGLNESDITESLEKNSKIIRSMTVYAPLIENEKNIASAAHADEEAHIFTVDELFVSVGKNIAVGDSLCRLTDYCKLAVQGKVFAVNEKALVNALSSKSKVSAAFEGDGVREIVNDLFVRSIDNKIDVASGTLFCYVDLKNDFTNYEVGSESMQRRYIQWHFKPGQRCELMIEAEPLPNCIVLPVGAVAKDFQEMCVFEWVGSEENSKIWRKKSVHVIYHTKDAVVIANDGALFPGAKVAVRGASLILAALDASNQKSSGGGGIQHGDHVH